LTPDYDNIYSIPDLMQKSHPVTLHYEGLVNKPMTADHSIFSTSWESTPLNTQNHPINKDYTVGDTFSYENSFEIPGIAPSGQYAT
jgi:hypothetical protein